MSSVLATAYACSDWQNHDGTVHHDLWSYKP